MFIIRNVKVGSKYESTSNLCDQRWLLVAISLGLFRGRGHSLKAFSLLTTNLSPFFGVRSGISPVGYSES